MQIKHVNFVNMKKGTHPYRANKLTKFWIFTALHGMQTRSSDENSVCPYVCLSVCQTRDL